MQISRLIRHLAAPHWRARLKFPSRSLDAIEQAVARVRAAGGEPASVEEMRAAL